MMSSCKMQHGYTINKDTTFWAWLQATRRKVEKRMVGRDRVRFPSDYERIRTEATMMGVLT